jgi:hypothetical protein
MVRVRSRYSSMSRLMNLEPLRRAGGLDVERGESSDDVVDGVVEAPEADARGDGGRLDGDVVDVLPGEQAAGLLEVVVGLLLAEHGLAEEVDVEAVSAGGEFGDGLAQLVVAGVDDHVADHRPDPVAGGGHHDLRDDRGQRGAHPDLRLVQGAEGVGHDGAEFGEGPSGGALVLGAHDAVDEADGEVEAVGVGEHGGEAFGGGVGLHVGGAAGVEPCRDLGDGGVGQRGEVVGRDADVPVRRLHGFRRIRSRACGGRRLVSCGVRGRHGCPPRKSS